MSVWKSVKNTTMEQNVDMEMLEKALENMGVELDYTVNSISTFCSIVVFLTDFHTLIFFSFRLSPYQFKLFFITFINVF